MRPSHVAVGAALGLLIGCEDSTGPRLEGINIVRGTGVIDTVGAIPSERLVVVVLDSVGAPVTGVEVRFAGVVDPESGVLTMLVSRTGADNFGKAFVLDTTDASGEADARVRLGTVAGVGAVSVSVHGSTARARFKIRPGRAVGIAASPVDTIIDPGHSFQVTASVVDQWGNPRQEAVSYARSTPNLTVSDDGRVSSRVLGRHWIVLTSSSFKDSVAFSVGPLGTIVAWDATNDRVVTLDLPGVNLQHVADLLPPHGNGAHVTPRWDPSGTEVLFAGQVERLGGPKMWRVVPGQSPRRIFDPPIPNLFDEFQGDYSSDGSWIFFSGRSGSQNFKLWRVHPDGSDPEVIVEPPLVNQLAWRSSPSPDASKLAFVTVVRDSAHVRVVDIATQTLSTWSVAGQSPRWSPVGDLIAFSTVNSGPLFVINADGTNRRQISEPGVNYAESAFGWSPDGEWLVARGGGVLNLIKVKTGLNLRIPSTADLFQPSWKP